MTNKPAKASSLGEKIYRKLREDITSCVLAPGEACTEAQLAETYGVGKAPVRWALAVLSREGLVSARPRQGYTVAPITIESVNDLFGVRLILEPSAARLAAGNADIALLKALHARVTKGWTAGDRRSHRGWVDANHRFHIEITRAAGNARLTRLATDVLEESERVTHVLISVYEHVRPMSSEHTDLIAALARGDGAAAERIAREHLEHTRRIVMDALLGNAKVRGPAIGLPGAGAALRLS